MRYAHVTNGKVDDIARVSPFSIFNQQYASEFISCPEEVDFGWGYVDGEWIAPIPPTPNYTELNKQQASSLLSSTDWVELPSVSDPSSTPHLTNVNEFLAYRSAVRAIAVNPPSEPAVFPEKPQESWSSV